MDSSRNRTFTGKFYFSRFLVSLHIVHTLGNIFRKIASLHFFERSGIAPIYVTGSIVTVWTWSLCATKSFRNGIYPRSVNMIKAPRGKGASWTTISHPQTLNKSGISSSQMVSQYLLLPLLIWIKVWPCEKHLLSWQSILS